MESFVRSEPQVFRHPPNHTLALDTFTWKKIPLCSSKPCDPALFDPDWSLIAAGVHVPLLVYVGGSFEGRRTAKANAKRVAKRWAGGRRHGDGGWGDT